MNIILVGFASCGKTTAASGICAQTGQRHFDLDRIVEERYERKHGKRASCREIFKDAGTDGFALLENDALRSLSNLRHAVLSTGGRTPMYEENHAILKSLGTVVYLKCGTGTVIERMKNKGVPLTMGKTPEDIAVEWEKRDPIYTKIADIVVDNDELTPEETARAILERLPGGSGG
jgi:shikimate kinase